VGEWGAFQCRLFRQADPRVELYVCGRDPRRVARVARAVGAKDCILGVERAIEDRRVEALALVLPHDLHAETARMAAAAGKHVLVEKPIATTLADADLMIDAARSAGTVLMVAEDVHFRPAVREAARLIDAGDVGDPLYCQVHAGALMRPKGWKADPARAGGGVLMDAGVHYVRALRLLMGEPDRVLASRARQVNTRVSVEDSVQLLFSSAHGWEAHVLLSWASPRGHGPDIIVAGDQGTVHLWPAAPYLDLYPAGPAAPRPLATLLSYVCPAGLALKLMSRGLRRVRRRIPDRDAGGYLTQVREFLGAVAEGRAPTSRPEDARRDLEIVLLGYEALRRGGWVTIR